MADYRVIINSRAGALVGGGNTNVLGGIRRALAEEGIDAELRVLTGEALRSAIAQAGDSEADRIIIGGGDGTVNSGASMAAATGKILGILPMGTLNLYAKDLGIPLDLEEAVHALVRGEVRRVDYAEVNGNLYLCNSVMGILPPLMQEHERLRDAPALKRYGSLLRMVYRVLKQNPRFSATLQVDGKMSEIKVRGIAVCNNEYHDAFSLFPHSVPLDSGKLTVYVANEPTRRGTLLLTLRLFLGTWQNEPDIMALPMNAITISSRRKRVATVTDGEILKLNPPLKYRVVPRGLHVLVPKTGDKMKEGSRPGSEGVENRQERS